MDYSRTNAFSFHGGGWGIRTPEGFHPTRFPSVRHRPLGESSVAVVDRSRTTLDHPNDKLQVAPRVALSRLTPLGRKRSKGNWALVGARGVFFVVGPGPTTWMRSYVNGLVMKVDLGKKIPIERSVSLICKVDRWGASSVDPGFGM